MAWVGFQLDRCTSRVIVDYRDVVCVQRMPTTTLISLCLGRPTTAEMTAYRRPRVYANTAVDMKVLHWGYQQASMLSLSSTSSYP